MKNRNWFWGVFFLLSAVFLIGTQTGAFGQIGIVTIVATIFLAAILINGIFELEFFSIAMSLAFLYMIYSGPLNFVYISPWTLVLAAILTSIGLNIIFRSYSAKFRFKRFSRHSDCEWKKHTKVDDNADDNNPDIKVSFGSTSKYLHSDNLQSGRFSMSFGAMEIYFDQVKLSPNGARIYVDCSFGEVKLYIPKQWKVIETIHVGLGAVDNKDRMSRPEENAPRLDIAGNVQFGNIEINYI